MKPRLSLLAALTAVAVQAPGAVAQSIVNVPTGDREVQPEVTEVFRVGSMAGEEWETFANVSSVAFDSRGNLYILDGDNHRVVVVDESGGLLRQFGKEGDGPGELRFPVGMVVAPDGSVAVMDLGHQAFVLYDADGAYVRNARNEFQTGLMGGDIDYHPRHGAVGIQSSMSFSSDGEAPPVGAPIRFVPFAENAEIEDLAMGWREPAEIGGGASFGGGGGGGLQLSGMPKLRAFEPKLGSAVLQDGRVAVIDSTAYSIKLVDPSGGIDAVIKRGIMPRAVAKRDQDAEVDRRREELERQAEEGGGGGNSMMIMSTDGGGATGGGGGRTMQIGSDQVRKMQEDRLASIVFADHIPVISDMAADMDGRIWVERTGDRVGEDGPTDLITADGDYLGTIPADGLRIPDAFGPGGLVVNIETDEYDIEYVVVSRVTRLDDH